MKSKLLTFDTKQWIAIAAGTVVAVFLVAALASAAVTISGNLQVGPGTASTPMNTDDAFITGTFEVDGATRFDGVTTFNANLVFPTNTDLTFTGDTGTNEIILINALADALSIQSGASDYMVFNTSSNTITFSKDIVVNELAAFNEDVTFNSKIKLTSGVDLLFTGAGTGTNEIGLIDGLADALSIKRGATDMMVFDSSTPRITFTPVVTFTGATTFNADIILAGGADVTFTGLTGTNEIVMPANVADGLSIKEAGAGDYITFDTTANTLSFTKEIFATNEANFADTVTFNTSVFFPAGKDIVFTGATTGDNEIKLVNGLLDALSINDGTADVVVYDTSTVGNVVTYTADLRATTFNGNTITTGTGVLTLAAGKTLTASNTLTLAGTDSTTMTFPSASATIARTDAGQTFTGVNTMTSPIFITPALGTPASGVLTNTTGYTGDSSLTTVGTIGTGIWEATDVGVAHGGTGVSSFTQYLLLYADTTTSLSQVAIGNSGEVLTSNGAGSVASFQAAGGVTGDTASADKELVRWNGTAGSTIESPVTDLSTTTATLSDNADVTFYDNVNDGNPVFSYGSSATERLTITASYASGGVALEFVGFDTPTGDATADFGEYRFNVDETLILTIDDNGLELVGDILFTNDNPEILGGDTDGVLTIGPDTVNNEGGRILLYGNTHGSKAHDIEFMAQTQIRLSWDDSQNNWDFDGENIRGIGAIVSVEDILAKNVQGFLLSDDPATTTNPTLIPNRLENDTGIGWASDTVHFVGGGATLGNIDITAFTVVGRVIKSTNTALTATAGGAQASTALSKDINFVTVVASGNDSVQLPVAVVGMDITVINRGANSLDVYGQTGDGINAGGANAAYAVATLVEARCIAVATSGATAWECQKSAR